MSAALVIIIITAAAEREAGALEPGRGSQHPCDADSECEAWSLRPLGFSLSVERLFGQTRVERRVEGAGVTVDQAYDAFNLLAAQTPHEGYSSPRLAADHLLPFGLSAGGAVGYHSVRRGDDAQSVWVLAPRLGYFWHFSRRLALWPRARMTWLWLDDAEDERAVTLELPILFLVAGGQLAVSLTPHLELGLPGGDVQLDERGVQAGATVFF